MEKQGNEKEIGLCLQSADSIIQQVSGSAEEIDRNLLRNLVIYFSGYLF